MYFEPGPKENKRDLYHFDKEYHALVSTLTSSHRLIIIKGLRRTGKTSLMTVVYNELKAPKLFIDARAIEGTSEQDVFSFFVSRFANYLKQKNMLKTLLETIESVDMGVTLNIKQQKPLLSSIVAEIDSFAAKDKTCFYLFIDEAQLLKSAKFDNFLAFIYDKLKNIKIVLAGSEIGLLDDFTGAKSDSPLYGRIKMVLSTRRFMKEESVAFLKTGFSQNKIIASDEHLEEAVASLNGTVGWLNMYGFYALSESHDSALAKVKKEGAKIVKDEISKFLKPRVGAEATYIALLRALSVEPLAWSGIKNHLQVKLKRNVSDSRLLSHINALEDYGFIEKKEGVYLLSDPLIKEALKSVL